jgi:hypothetical protein
MDTAVGLVETYLRVNGYFTVVEYPVMELEARFRTATDLDVLAVRFPGASRLIPGEDPPGPDLHPPFEADPALEVPSDRVDMLVCEVKEGEAAFNRSGRRPEVLAAALARFGCCSREAAPRLVRELLSSGSASPPGGHAIRLVAFGSSVGESRAPYLRIPLGHVLRFLEEWTDAHWPVLRHAQLKDPVLGFLSTLAKARAGGGTG